MAKTTEQLVRIAASGGGLKIDWQGKTTDQLVRIAAASHKGAQIIILNAGSKTTEQLVRIAAAGKGCVLFDIVE